MENFIFVQCKWHVPWITFILFSSIQLKITKSYFSLSIHSFSNITKTIDLELAINIINKTGSKLNNYTMNIKVPEIRPLVTLNAFF